jgi:hypothetical protein
MSGLLPGFLEDRVRAEDRKAELRHALEEALKLCLIAHGAFG